MESDTNYSRYDGKEDTYLTVREASERNRKEQVSPVFAFTI